MSVPSTRKKIFVLVVALAIAQAAALGVQEQTPYTAVEYQAYQEAVNADVAKREDEIVAFMKQNPESALVPYAVGAYIQMMQGYQNGGQAQKVVTAGEKLLALKPDELNTLYMTAVASFQVQQFQKAVQYGEKIYAHKPEPGLAFILATSYGQLKNEDKLLEYGPKACAEIAPKDSYQIIAEIMQIHARRSEWQAASEWATRTIEAFDAAQTPPQTSEADWNKYVGSQKTVAFAILGRRAAEGRRWNTTITNYQKVLGLEPGAAQRGEAYYYIGRGRWEQKRIDPAMEAFARGSVQRGAPHARQCRQHLEQLYRSTHNDSLAGIEEFVERVTRGR